MSILYYIGISFVMTYINCIINIKLMKAVMISLFLLPLTCTGQYKLLSTEGKYQGKNIYVNNPQQNDGFGYCVIKATVNGDVLPASIQSSNFEIDFDLFDLEIGDDVFVVIEHFEGCTPRFLNPEALLPQSTFEIVDISIDKNATIRWKTKNEGGILDFQIEKFKWNSWISVGQVRGKGGSAQNQYSFNLPLHSGKNKVRISQIDNTGKPRSSKALEYPSKIAPFTMGPSSVRDYLYFYSNNKKSKTRFEVLDAYGNLLKAGYANNVDCKNIVNGIYYINYDNTTEKFIKVNK